MREGKQCSEFIYIYYILCILYYILSSYILYIIYSPYENQSLKSIFLESWTLYRSCTFRQMFCGQQSFNLALGTVTLSDISVHCLELELCLSLYTKYILTCIYEVISYLPFLFPQIQIEKSVGNPSKNLNETCLYFALLFWGRVGLGGSFRATFSFGSLCARFLYVCV